MKKVITVLLYLAIAPSMAHAQVFRIGPRVGAGIAQIKRQKSTNSTTQESQKPLGPPRIGLGYQLGAFTRLSLPMLYIQPEVLITGARIKFGHEDDTFSLHFTKLDVPALVGISFLGCFRAQLGPVFSWLLYAKEEKNNVKKHYSNVTVGGQAGIGIDLANIIIDLKYERSFSRFGDKIADNDTKHGYDLLLLSVGFNML